MGVYMLTVVHRRGPAGGVHDRAPSRSGGAHRGVARPINTGPCVEMRLRHSTAGSSRNPFPRTFPVTAFRSSSALPDQHTSTSPHHLSAHQTHQTPISPIFFASPSIAMAASLRSAAPKMASMAAQSVARPAFKPQQLQKFARAYSGELLSCH